MSEQRPRQHVRRPAGADESRLLPLSVAGLVCFLIATALGYGGWYFFGSRETQTTEDPSEAVRQTREADPAPPAETPAAPAPAPPPVVTAPAGELPVPGGEAALGGEGPESPLRRVLVKAFRVAESEVTNEQYQQFLKATGRKAPANWKRGEFPPGAALEPVTGVTWDDAAEYCRWLSQQIGATVRLPTEAEWEWAARGPEGLKYPWGNEWNGRAADSVESGGLVRAVKSFPAGKSPFGAYDMAGNVWEWTADAALDAEGRPQKKDGAGVMVIKGGAAKEPRAFVNATARYAVAADKSSPTLGFRYVVERAEQAAGAGPPAGA